MPWLIIAFHVPMLSYAGGLIRMTGNLRVRCSAMVRGLGCGGLRIGIES
jgi:hypothetical protein